MYEFIFYVKSVGRKVVEDGLIFCYNFAPSAAMVYIVLSHFCNYHCRKCKEQIDTKKNVAYEDSKVIKMTECEAYDTLPNRP